GYTEKKPMSEAAVKKKLDQFSAVLNHCLKSEAASRINAMLDLARSESGIPILPEQFDRNPWLLNCPNGTLELQTAERRKTVASLFLRGKFQHEIAKEAKVDRGTVSRDLKAVEAEWLKSGVMDLNAAKARALAKIDEIEREAWDAFKQSRKESETREVTGTTQGGKGKPEKVKKTTKGQAGDSRFLAIILDCVKRRC